MAVNAPASAGAITSFSAADTKGNAWNQRSFIIGSNANAQMAILGGHVSTQLTSSDTVTITCNTRSPASWVVIADEFDDLTASGAFNAQGTGTSTGSSFTATVTGTAPNAQLLYAAVGFASTTAVATFTSVDGSSASGTTTTTPKVLRTAWRYIATGATRTVAGTISTSPGVWAEAVTAWDQDALTQEDYGRRIRDAAGTSWVQSETLRQVGGTWVP